MKLPFLALLLAGIPAIRGDCGWDLTPSDCLCMNSANGSAWTEFTDYCCKAMGQRTTGRGPVCNVAKEFRQTFKDCCKFQNQESLIGHCR